MRQARHSAEITALLVAHRAGRPEALEELIPLVYDQLRRLARSQRRRAPSSDTLGTTGLVHEAYVRLIDQARVDWQDRGHFFAVCATAMRRILIDEARRRSSAKRGRATRPVELTDVPDPSQQSLDQILDIDRALEKLAGVDPQLVRVVECRYFSGLSESDTAEALGMSLRTAQREWSKARAWLRVVLATDSAGA